MANYSTTFLFGTNEFLKSDVYNIFYSLQQIITFLKQHNLREYNGNHITQLLPFSQVA